MSDPTPGMRAIETVGQVIGDLVRIAEKLPIADPQDGETTAAMLDKLAAELGEAAVSVRLGIVKPAAIRRTS